MLVGSFVNTIDDKGRVFVPAKFRDDLGASFVMLYDIRSGCIAGYPEAVWESAVAKMQQKPRSEREAFRVIMKYATTVEPDKQGRVILPPELRKLAGVDCKTEVIVIGEMNCIELWSKQRWDAYEQAQLESGAFAIPEDIGL